MDPDGNTDKLLSSYRNDEMVQRSNTSTVVSSEIDERRNRCQNKNLIQPKLFPPQSIFTTGIQNMTEGSSIGSDDVLSYCYDSEKSVVSNNSCHTKDIFRESEWYTAENGNTIIIPSTQSYKTSSSHDELTMNSSTDEETTIYLLEDGSFPTQDSDDDENSYNGEGQFHVNNSDDGSIEIIMYPTTTSSSKLRNQQLDEQHLKSVRIQSFIIGVLIGLLMQFSTLGANFLASSYRLSNIANQIQFTWMIHNTFQLK